MATIDRLPMFALFTENGLDQIVETRALANREARDLRAMGCTVRIVECKTVDQLAAIEELN